MRRRYDAPRSIPLRIPSRKSPEVPAVPRYTLAGAFAQVVDSGRGRMQLQRTEKTSRFSLSAPGKAVPLQRQIPHPICRISKRIPSSECPIFLSEEIMILVAGATGVLG